MKSENEICILCQSIRCLRKAHGLSKTQMALILGISIRGVSLIEKDILPPRLSCEVLWRAHDYFQIPVYKLFENNME